MQVLGRSKPQGQGHGRRIVNQSVQRGTRPAVFEPGMRAGIELHKLAQRGGPLAAPAMLRRPAAMARRPPERQAQAPHAGPTDRQGVLFLQLLREMDIVEPLIHGRHEPYDLAVEFGRQPARGASAAATVQQAPRAVGPKAYLQPLELPHAEPQGPRPFLVGNLPGQGRFHEPGPGHFLSAHRECLHGGTFSRNS